MRYRLALLFALTAVLGLAGGCVSLSDLDAEGWNSYIGQRITVTDRLIVCGTFRDSIHLAAERLYVPEERALGLADGDSTAYWQHVAYNNSRRITLVCKVPFWLNLGATLNNLQAYVTGNRKLQTGQQPRFRNYKPSKRLPDLGKPDLTICCANIQNYFVHLGGYASKRTTPQQHELQRLKVSSALVRLNADLYALCELEKGPSAPAELAAAMNELAGKTRYDYLRTSPMDGDTISVGFIYRSDKIKPYGTLRFAYTPPDIYAYRFMLQGFEDLNSGERFVVSLNHPRSKRGDAETANALRMENIAAIMWTIHKAYADSTYSDPDILMLGDYNAYRFEEPLQTIVSMGFRDMLAQDSLAYSYSYKGECGSLDRVYATPSMAQQITAIHHIHWNTDVYYSAGFQSKYNFSSSTDSSKSIRKQLTRSAKKNLLFRYSDHDPVLIGVRFQ